MMTKRRSVLLAQAWWQDRILKGVAGYALTHNWELQFRMHWTHQPPRPSEWDGDGIIAFVGVSKWLRKASRPLINFIRQAGVPVVETQAYANYFGGPQVIIPHATIGRMAAEYFLGLNFRHLGYVAFDENPLEQHKRTAFRQAVEKAGCTFHALTPKSLEQGIAQLPRPMALFAMNDPNALAVIRLCLDAGFHVPEEFAVLGVDDNEIVCDLGVIPLSSINCNLERLGYEAAALLDRLMDGRRKPARTLEIPPAGVTVRRSTDIIAIPDLETARTLRFLRDHYREPRNIQQMLDELDVPLRHVHGMFRQYVGRTPLQELTRLRVDHSKKLMLDPRRKLETIAHESGFSNRFHFTQAFRRVTGVTPREHRRKIFKEAKADPVP